MFSRGGRPHPPCFQLECREGERLLPFKSAESAELTSLTYDRVAEAYDDLWSPHVVRPNARLTKSLGIERGDRIADLACGTGVYTLEMAVAAAPGEVVAVDYSKDAGRARSRAEDAGSLPDPGARARREFHRALRARELRRVSFRFVLATSTGTSAPSHGAPAAPRGRVGALTLDHQQAHFYHVFDGSGRPSSRSGSCTTQPRTIPETWKMFPNCARLSPTPLHPFPIPRGGPARRGAASSTDPWTRLRPVSIPATPPSP